MDDPAGQTIDAQCMRLLKATAGGDRHAFADLFKLEAGRLLAIARRILRRTDLAEEVVQESFVTVWQKAPQFEPARGNARAWLTVIVRNRALNMLRDGARVDLHDFSNGGDVGDAALDAQNAYADLDQDEDLKRCLATLPEERRRSILLAYVVGFTHGEIAARLKAPVGTVKAWIRRGVVALQECMS